jgi:ketosteroid isomerase-like protein
MSQNKTLIENLGRTDVSKIAPLLTDDVEWVEWGEGVPAHGSIRRGKKEFIGNYGDDQLHTEITRMIEENNVVVVEGHVRVTKKDGRTFRVQFCDIYELEGGKVRRKSSYGALVKDSA